MRLTRREATLLAAAAALTPNLARARAFTAQIFYDAGTPDHADYERAIAKGADFLVAPVVVTQDGALACAPDVELSAFTDVATRSEFAERRKDKTLDGASVSGWFCDDFTMAELKTLATGPTPKGARPPAAPPTVLSLVEVIGIARAGSVREARVVGVSPRMVRPEYFSAQDLRMERKLAALIAANGYNSPAAAMIVQAREPMALKAFGEASRARRAQITGATGDQGMLTDDSLAAMRGWAEGIAAAELELVGAQPKGPPAPTGLAQAAHAARLAVFARVSPPGPHEPFNTRAGLTALFAAGVDGVMCADVALAAKARGEAMDRLRAANPG